ncbi:hypothetical protein K7432_006521 [Basidiobolus ranarum]|uniref:Uncharacterized protein n=1 Tax=Basidiobolus ranarum TaxID=34480 RepID=A0ABR2W2A0_9FUNG
MAASEYQGPYPARPIYGASYTPHTGYGYSTYSEQNPKVLVVSVTSTLQSQYKKISYMLLCLQIVSSLVNILTLYRSVSPTSDVSVLLALNILLLSANGLRLLACIFGIVGIYKESFRYLCVYLVFIVIQLVLSLGSIVLCFIAGQIGTGISAIVQFLIDCYFSCLFYGYLSYYRTNRAT